MNILSGILVWLTGAGLFTQVQWVEPSFVNILGSACTDNSYRNGDCLERETKMKTRLAPGSI